MGRTAPGGRSRPLTGSALPEQGVGERLGVERRQVVGALAVHGESGWQAAALLGVRRVRGVDRLVACGHGPSDAVTMPAVDDEHARLLAERLRAARLVAGDVSPVLVADAGPSLRDYVTGKHRRGVSRFRNRMEREGVDPRVEHLSDRGAIEALLPELERVHRDRDRVVGRRSAMDVPHEREFFRRVVLDHAAIGQVSLTTLHLQEQLAAYVLCFVDGDVHRMWATRFAPEWDRYSPGKVAMEASVEHALAAGATAYDFMRGEERYKSGYANATVVAQDLFAASGRARSAATAAALATRARMREAHERGGRGARFVEATRRLRDRVGGP